MDEQRIKELEDRIETMERETEAMRRDIEGKFVAVISAIAVLTARTGATPGSHAETLRAAASEIEYADRQILELLATYLEKAETVRSKRGGRPPPR